MPEEKRSRSWVRRILEAISLEAILSGFGLYQATLRRTLRHRGRLGRELFLREHRGMLATAFSVYLYGLALSFFLYLPFIYRHGVDLGKLVFLLQMLALTVVGIGLGHLSLKVIGGRGSLRQTAAVGLTYNGLLQPLIMVLYVPVFWFGAVEDVLLQGRFGTEAMEASIALAPAWVRIWHEVAQRVLFLLGFLILARWVADAHRISRWSVLVGTALIFPPLNVLAGDHLYPRLSAALRAVGNFLDHLV